MFETLHSGTDACEFSKHGWTFDDGQLSACCAYVSNLNGLTGSRRGLELNDFFGLQ